MAEPGKTLSYVLDRIAEAQHVLSLVNWIQHARAAADALTQAEEHDEELAAKLRQHRVCGGWPWDSVEDGGLDYLMGHMRQLLSEAEDIGLELQRLKHPAAA